MSRDVAGAPAEKAPRAIVLAAGQGTRMRSQNPKVLHGMLGRPMVLWVLEAARRAGAGGAVLVVGHGREAVEACVRAWAPEDFEVRFAVQPEQRGTADAVRCALPALADHDGLVLVLYGDVPNIRPETLRRLQALCPAGEGLSLITAQVADPTGYGRLVRQDGAAVAIVEHKDCTAEQRLLTEINAGLYAMPLAFLRARLDAIDDTNRARELYLTDLIAMAAGASGAATLCVDDDQEVQGVNDRAQLAAAAGWAQRRILRDWMAAGVSVEDPDHTWVEPDVQLGRDVRLGPGVCLRGRTVVGDGAWVDAHCVVDDSTVGAEARVGAGSVLCRASVAAGATLPALTRRP